jgi:hypothetical protein
MGCSDGRSGREINHFFAYDDRAFQRGALLKLGISGPLPSILPLSATHQPIPVPYPTFRPQLNRRLIPILHYISICKSLCRLFAQPLKHRATHFFFGAQSRSFEPGVIVIFANLRSFSRVCPRCAACAINFKTMPLRGLSHVSYPADHYSVQVQLCVVTFSCANLS